MIRLIILELVFLVTLLLAIPVLLITDFPGPDHQPNPSRLVSFTESNPFLFSIPNSTALPLNSLSLTLKNPLIANRSEISLSLILPDGSTHQSLSFSGANVGDPSSVNLAFTPVSAPLTISLTTSNTVPETLFVFTSESLIPRYSTTFHPPNLLERLKLVYSSLTSRVFKINSFYLIAYPSLILLLTYVITRRL